jgi:adenine-specific DNA-methyltransferase
MMEKRLRIAAHLLKPDGVLICTIDEHEVHHLGMLLEKVFRGYVHYMITVVINPKGREKANFAPVEEFAFFVVPDSQEEVIARAPQELSNDDGPGDDGPGDDGTDEPTDVDRSDDATAVPAAGAVEPQWEYRHARRRGGGAESSSYRRKRHNQFYPIYIDEKQRKVVRVGPSIPKDEVPDTRPKDGLRPIWPIDKEGHHRVWAFVSPSMQRLIDRGDVSLGKYHKQRDDWTIRYRVPKRTTRKLKTVWWKKSHDAGTHGTEMLKKLLGAQGLFSFPKSVYAVEDCLAAVVRNRPQALIVDFFAGSGTTFHATCLLNAEDGGTRRSILVTHNEVDESTTQRLHKENLFRGQPGFEKYGIFERVARPRSEAVVTGLRRDGTPVPGKHTDGRRLSAGFPENLEFFQLEYLDRNEVDLRRKFEALYPALWLAADGVGDRLDLTENPDMLVPANAPYAILLREELFGVFLKSIQLRQDIKRVWLVTDSEDAFAEMRARLAPEIRASMLYRDYLRNFAGSPRGLV